MDAPNADGRKVMTMTAWPSDIGSIAGLLVEPAKGSLPRMRATSTIKRRFDAIGVENTEDNRRALPRICSSRRAADRGVHQRRDPVRRNDPPESC